ncbi:DMT family transporter [Hirschia litorea]|uniref:DMT family transporter n=1 Tax=Hirschia litorea TaxID=1199156 RepID=A0ABW2IJC7_9PROT
MSQANSHSDKPVLGLTFRLIAIASLATMFMLVKFLGERDVHVVEMLFYRFLFGFVMMGLWVFYRNGLASLKTKRVDLHISRAITGAVGMGLNFGAVMLLPMAEAATISFTVPLIATLLSVILLSEYVGLRRWIAVVVGFIGIVIAIQPWHNNIPPIGAAVAFAGAVMTALTIIIVRKLSATESSATIVFYYTAMSVPVLAIAMFWFGKAHSWEIFGLLALIGLFGTIGQITLSESLRYANVAVVMPMDYSNLIFATFFGYMIWDQWPVDSLWFGLPLIVGSGIYIALREHKLSIQRAQHPENIAP